MLQFYWIHLLVLIVLVCVETLGFFTHSVMSSTNSEVLIFPTWIPFISFSCLIVVDRLTITCWIETARMCILVLFLILEGKLLVFTSEYDVSSGFVIDGFYYVEMCSLYAQFDESFCHEWMLNFVKCFFCIYWDDHVIFILLLLMWYITLIDLWILNHACFPGINPTWLWCMILL